MLWTKAVGEAGRGNMRDTCIRRRWDLDVDPDLDLEPSD